MVLSLSALGEPVGSMKQWLPSTTGSAGATIPLSWLVCDGSVVADASSTYNGITLPDTRAQFKRGHSTITNANFPSNAVYKAGGTIPAGGSDSNNLSHSHSYGFNIDHQHTEQNHSHSVSNYSHNHTQVGGNQFNDATPLGATSSDTHNHGGSTGSTSPGNTSTMNSGANITGSVNNSLGSTENRPAFQEYVTIIKVK